MEENNNNNFETTPEEETLPAPVDIQEEEYDSLYKQAETERINKHFIRSTALGVGIPALCLSAIGYIWPFIYLFFTQRVAGMTYEDAITLSENPAMQQILQIVISCFMFLVPFTIAAKSMGLRIDKIVNFGRAEKGTFLPYVLFGVGFCSFANIAMSYSSQIFENFGIDYDVDFGDSPRGIFGFLLSFIATAIVPALVEEFACRGIILGILKKHGQGFAVITSSIVFGIMHGNFEQIPFAVLVGLILGYIYVKTGSIWTCVAVHSVNNAISVIFTYLEDVMLVNTQNLLYVVFLIISLLAAVISILLCVSKGKENFELEAAEDDITNKQKYTWFFTSWAIILFVVFNLLESLAYFVV